MTETPEIEVETVTADQLAIALHGVCIALDDEQLSTTLEHRDVQRIAGLALAARLLSGWLLERID